MSLVQIDQTGSRNAVNPARLDPTNDQVAIGRWNGATYDAETGNMDIIVLAPGPHSATYVGTDLVNYNAKGAMIFFNVTAVPGTDTVNIRVDSKDPASGVYSALFVAATPVSATGAYRYLIYPGGTAANGGQLTAAPCSIVLPRTFRVQVVHSSQTSSFTYSVGMSLIV
jgi:hypothetical protein